MKLSRDTILLIYLGALMVIAALGVGQLVRIVHAVFLVALAFVAQAGVVFYSSGKWQWSWRPVISALLIAVMLDTITHPLFAALAVILIAITPLVPTRFVHYVREPVATSAVLVSFFAPVVSWWALGWGIVPLAIVIVGDLALIAKTKQYRAVVVFCVFYSLMLGARAMIGGAGFGHTIGLFFADGIALFFASVFFTDPLFLASPRPLLVAGAVGILAALLTLAPRLWMLGNMDPLLLAFVISQLLLSRRASAPVPVDLAR